jgi:hypothetical protein
MPAGPVGPRALNRLRTGVLESLAASGVASEPAATVVAGEQVPAAGHSLVLVARQAADPAVAVGWVSADPPAAIAGLERKLPHYTRYSYLAFRGDEPRTSQGCGRGRCRRSPGGASCRACCHRDAAAELAASTAT